MAATARGGHDCVGAGALQAGEAAEQRLHRRTVAAQPACCAGFEGEDFALGVCSSEHTTMTQAKGALLRHIISAAYFQGIGCAGVSGSQQAEMQWRPCW